MSISRPVGKVFACGVLCVLGGLAGFLMGFLMPGYHRGVFRGELTPGFDPVQVGLVQGIPGDGRAWSIIVALIVGTTPGPDPAHRRQFTEISIAMSDALQVGRGRIELVLGNLVEQEVDAIVNAANTKLTGGGGVDGAIHKAAGPALKEECHNFPADEQGRRCPTGEVRVTGAGNLPARWVIHAVGPFYNERYAGKARDQLRQVHRQALEAAAARDCRSIAFPAISTGAYRFPMEAAARLALETAAEWLREAQALELIRFVLFRPAQLETFRTALEEVENTR